MACYNRRETTLECLRRLELQQLPVGTDLKIYLVDDGSSDGTSEAVKAKFPNVVLLRGDGSLYHYGALRMAWDKAKQDGFDATLLMNDDDVLDEDALMRALEWSQKLGTKTICGGAMRDPDDGHITYSGMIRPGIHRLRMPRIFPDKDNPTPVEALNGNFVLVPYEVVEKLGNFAPYLIQSGGDVEFTLRATKNGFQCVLLPGTFGTCPTNPPGKKAYGFGALKQVMSVKDTPPSMMVPFCRAHAGKLWFVWLFCAYAGPFVKGYSSHI